MMLEKSGVPDNILRKNEKLTDSEYAEIKKHTTIGAHILSTSKMFQDIIPIVEHHHEKFDGTGYPDNLKGDEIPYLARVTAVADCFDAMTSKRIYRDSLSLDFVKNEIKKISGTQLDPNISNAFLDLLENDYDSISEIQNKYKF